MNIGIIEEKRKQKRITVKELCDSVGIERTTYYRILKNPDSMKISTWYSIVSFLGLTQIERKQSLE